MSRRGSALGSESRRGSALISESRRMSALGSESKRGSTQGLELRRESGVASESSRKSSLAHSERRRSSGEKGGGRNEEVWSHHKLPEGVMEEIEELTRSSTASSLELSLEQSQSAVATKQEVGEDGDIQSPWLQKEKFRRIREAVESLVKDAELGKCGVLTETFSIAIPHHLSLAYSKGAPSVQYVCIPLMGHYSTKAFISEALALLESTCVNTSSDVFQLTPSGYLHVLADQDWAKTRRKVLRQLYSTQFILINRNILQWEECYHDSKQPTQDCGPPQLFATLDSNKLTSGLPGPPLQTIAEARSVFIPRRMLVLMRVSEQKVTLCVCVYGLSMYVCPYVLCIG